MRVSGIEVERDFFIFIKGVVLDQFVYNFNVNGDKCVVFVSNFLYRFYYIDVF